MGVRDQARRAVSRTGSRSPGDRDAAPRVRPRHEGRDHERRGVRRGDRRARARVPVQEPRRDVGRRDRRRGRGGGRVRPLRATAGPRSTDRLQPRDRGPDDTGPLPRSAAAVPAGRPVLAVMLALLRQDRGPVLRGLAALWRVVWARWWVPLLTTAGAAWAVWALVGQAELSTLAAAALIVLVVPRRTGRGRGLPGGAARACRLEATRQGRGTATGSARGSRRGPSLP